MKVQLKKHLKIETTADTLVFIIQALIIIILTVI